MLGHWVAGKWPLEGKMLDTDYSEASTVAGVSSCAWSPDHVFMLCHQASWWAVSLTATFRFSFTIRPTPAFTSWAVSKRRAAIHDGPGHFG